MANLDEDEGLDGVNLHAHARHDDPGPARRGLGPDKRLICAGGVDSLARVAALREAGCDAFTIGSAAFALAFSAAPDLPGQLRDILACA